MNKNVTVMILLFSASLLFGHGIEISVGKKYPCVFLKVDYQGGNTMTHVDVSVFFEKKEYQKGNTDKNGVFSFCPDQTGKWIVIVDDLMGHRKRVEIIINNEFLNPPTKNNDLKPVITKKDACCYLLKIVLGVLLILGITFILYRWKKKA